jgi:hypothetical protein
MKLSVQGLVQYTVGKRSQPLSKLTWVHELVQLEVGTHGGQGQAHEDRGDSQQQFPSKPAVVHQVGIQIQPPILDCLSMYLHICLLRYIYVSIKLFFLSSGLPLYIFQFIHLGRYFHIRLSTYHCFHRSVYSICGIFLSR